jgi:hypothetical protein
MTLTSRANGAGFAALARVGEEQAARASRGLEVGFGRIVALYYRSSTPYRIR